MLKRIDSKNLPSLRRDPVDAETIAGAAKIVEAVRDRGEVALREYAERFGDVKPGGLLVRGPDELKAALDALPAADRGVLERTAGRVRRFAEAQKGSLQLMETGIPGGFAGHTITPVDRAGCYAPGGRFPLPSSVLMTAVTARVAGVREVWVASPKPAPATLAAASIAGADALLCVGGAQAIAALAHGAGAVPACDVIAGPGNRWVTAAKQLVVGRVAIDMLAGPSELVVLADGSADPAVVAADLLAQAEHDPDAMPILVALDAALADAVDAEVVRQLETLPTKDIAGAAVRNGFCIVAGSLDEAIAVCDRLAPEHLELHIKEAAAVAPR